MVRKKHGEAMDVSDARFAAVHRDPRFSRFPRKQTSVTIDERFKGVLNDPDFQVTSTVNKHGKKVNKKTQNDDMRRFYHLQEDDEDDDDSAPAEVSIKKSAREVKAAAKAAKLASAPASAAATPAKKRFDSDSEADVEDGEAADVAGDGVTGAARGAVSDGGRDSSDSGGDGGAGEAADDEAGDASVDGDEIEVGEKGASESSGDDDEEGVAERAQAKKGGRVAKRARDISGDADDVEAEAKRRYDLMRGIGSDVESSSDEEGMGDDAEEEIEIGGTGDVELDPSEWGVGAAAGNPEADPTLILLDDATPRLAVVDLDWQRMRAVDIFAVLRSFVSGGGSLRKVTVYVSEYGRAQMARERELGPQGLHGGDDAEASSDDGEDVSETQAQERLRMYERSKLRWFFAVAEFGSAATASAVYDECDGIEFEESSVRFDLRFVPDSESFAAREVRDEATDLPAGYEAPMFKSKALQHTNPTLTWDEDDASRKKALHRKLNADEVKEEDFAAYLASESEADEDGGDVRDAGSIRERYAALIGAPAAAAADGSRKRGGMRSWKDCKHVDGDHGDAAEGTGAQMEMEVTFAPGLENLGKRILEKKAVHKARAGQTLFEQYLDRKKEKKAKQRAVGRVNVDSESDSEDERAGGRDAAASGGADDFFSDDRPDGGAEAGSGFDDPFFNDDGNVEDASDSDSDGAREAAERRKLKATAKSASLSKPDKEAARRQKAELELLMLDDAKLAAAQRGESVTGLAGKGDAVDGAKPKLSRKQHIAMKKEQRKRAKERRDSDDDECEADIDDPRFQAITNPEFAIDSTDPHFSRIKNPKKLISEISHRRKKVRTVDSIPGAEIGAKKSSQRSELAALVGNLKRKGQGSGNQKNWG